MAIQLPEVHSSARDCVAYYGDREGWHVALTVNRDSDVLDRSNWEVITDDVLSVPNDGADDDLPDAAIERFSHFLCGWVEHLMVRPGSTAERRAIEWRERLDTYTIASEEHYYGLESAEEWCTRCDRATREDHDSRAPYACGKFRSRDDAEDIISRWHRRGRNTRNVGIARTVDPLTVDMFPELPAD